MRIFKLLWFVVCLGSNGFEIIFGNEKWQKKKKCSLSVTGSSGPTLLPFGVLSPGPKALASSLTPYGTTPPWADRANMHEGRRRCRHVPPDTLPVPRGPWPKRGVLFRPAPSRALQNAHRAGAKTTGAHVIRLYRPACPNVQCNMRRTPNILMESGHHQTLHSKHSLTRRDI